MRILNVIILSLVLLVALALPILAQTYYADVTLKETVGNSYDMFPALASFNTDYLASEGYVNATALDTRMLDGTNEIPHMLSDDKLLFATDLPGSSSKTMRFTAGNSLLSAFGIIIGRDGYITTADNATLELGDNWTVEEKGWVDTSYNSTKNLVFKEGALRTYISATENITSEILSTVGQQSYKVNDDAGKTIQGNLWSAQTFTTVGAYKLTSINLKLLRVLTPGDLTVSIRNTVAGNVTGADLTVGTIDGNSLTLAAGGAWYSIDLTDYDLAAATMYAIVTRALDGNPANNVGWRADVTAPAYGGGTRCTSGDGGVTWAIEAVTDFLFETVGETVVDTVTAINFPSEEYTVTTTANVTHFWIEIDHNVEDITPLTANVTDNATDWIWAQNNVLPYSDNFTITVDDVQQLFYKPATYILGDNLPDLTGTSQNGTITWGANDTGVAVIVGSLVAYAEATGVDPDVGAADPVGEVRAPSGLFPSEVRMKATLHIFYDVAEDISDVTGFPVQFFWWFGTALMTICSMVASMRWLPNIWWMGVVGIFALGMGVGQAFIPGYFIILGVLAVIFAVLTERTPSI